MPGQRLFKLDLIRFFALFCIVLCHTKIADEDYLLIEKVNWFIGKCGVPIFLILSGYLGLPTGEGINIKKYFAKKAKRILLPFVIWIFIYMPVAVEREFPLFQGDILNQASAHLWYIYAILGLYIISPVISPYLRTASQKELICYLALWGLTGFFPLFTEFSAWPYHEHNWMYMLHYLYGYIGWYILGFYFKKFPSSILLTLKASILFLLLFIFIIYCGFFVFGLTTVTLSDYKGWPVMLYSIACYGIVHKIEINNSLLKKIITNISVHSFGVYLIHMLPVVYLYPHLPKIEYFPVIVSNIIYSILNIICSYMIVYYVSKIKYFRLIFGN